MSLLLLLLLVVVLGYGGYVYYKTRQNILGPDHYLPNEDEIVKQVKKVSESAESKPTRTNKKPSKAKTQPADAKAKPKKAKASKSKATRKPKNNNSKAK